MSDSSRMTQVELVTQMRLRNRVLLDFKKGISPLPKTDHPKNLRGYREWEAKSLGIRKITSKSHTHEKQLKKKGNLRAVSALHAANMLLRSASAILKGPLRGRRKPLGEQNASIKAKAALAEQQRDAMAVKYTESAAEVNRLEVRLAAKTRELSDAQQIISELRKETNLLKKPAVVSAVKLLTKPPSQPKTPAKKISPLVAIAPNRLNKDTKA